MEDLLMLCQLANILCVPIWNKSRFLGFFSWKSCPHLKLSRNFCFSAMTISLYVIYAILQRASFKTTGLVTMLKIIGCFIVLVPALLFWLKCSSHVITCLLTLQHTELTLILPYRAVINGLCPFPRLDPAWAFFSW